MGRRPTDPLPRFWAKVEKTDTCWNWTGSKQKHGHGQFSVNGKAILAYRYSFQLHKGEIPAGKFIDHLCHNPSCVKPDHLRLATPKQNMENRRGAHKNSASGIRGVFPTPSGKWRVRVKHFGKTINLGTYASIHDAEKVAVDYRRSIFSVTN